jgi:hypothetical protein
VLNYDSKWFNFQEEKEKGGKKLVEQNLMSPGDRRA